MGWDAMRRGLAAGLVMCLVAGVLPAAAAAQEPVDLELVLTVDASASVTGGAMEFQLRGHAAALRDPRVAAAATSGPNGAIAVTLAGFAGPGAFDVLVPWTRIADAQDAAAFAERVEASLRPVRAGNTALGSAIDAAVLLFGDDGFEGGRKVVDLVANGFSNAGPPVEDARDRAVAAGVTVNGLAILDEYAWLDAYFSESVIGGPGAFVRTAENRDSFADAILYKLIDEIVEGPADVPGPILAMAGSGGQGPGGWGVGGQGGPR
ncbi:DUF1194 domain-containing protein [Arenibaculum sp.]|uniref:DUF1194 domain-containing protein n=1 Tax=Arenibaculum sp. TaxID=2865862 RepID=UPI002E0F7B3F|nr:DUF1194 domain-containing protein [Arenibaculum sp.]